MKDLVDTTEMYLRTIYELEEEGIVPLRARIAERLEQSGPTVSQTVNRMDRDGLVHVANDRSLKMSEEGRRKAIAVMRKHRLAEQLLADKIGLDILKVHAEACRWEHVMSEAVERRLVEVLPECTRSPFGNPIPGLEELGVVQPHPPVEGERGIDLPQDRPLRCRVVALNEIFQCDNEQVRQLLDSDMFVDAVVDVKVSIGRVTLSKNGKHVDIKDELAHAIRLERL